MSVRSIRKAGIARPRRGLTLIEAALSLGVAALVLVGLAQLLASAGETTRARAVSDRMTEITSAAQEYVQANFAQLMQLPDIKADKAVKVAVAKTSAGGAVPAGPGGGLESIQGGGFLPSSFVDLNAYNQSSALILKRVDDTRLEGVLTTVGGNTIEDRQLGRIATFVGADGGFMMTTPLPNTAGLVTGTNGGWSTQASLWDAGADAVPKTGHVMSSLAFNEGSVVGDYLARNDIGIPEANTMRTNLNMGANDINNVTAITKDDFGDNDAISGTSITLNDDKVSIGPNLEVAGYITAGTDITATDGKMTAHKFVDVDDPSFLVDPKSDSNLNQLTTATLSADTALFDSNGALDGTLKDRLPNYVTKTGYLVTASANVVAKPACGAGGTPKITFSPIYDNQQFASDVVVTGVSASSGSNVTITLNNKSVQTARKWLVAAAGNSWTVTAQGTTFFAPWSGLAMTYCYYVR